MKDRGWLEQDEVYGVKKPGIVKRVATKSKIVRGGKSTKVLEKKCLCGGVCQWNVTLKKYLWGRKFHEINGLDFMHIWTYVRRTWKIHFYVKSILGQIWVSKIAILTSLEAFNFDFCTSFNSECLERIDFTYVNILIFDPSKRMFPTKSISS